MRWSISTVRKAGLEFKESLQNSGVVYSRGIRHDETLTTLEPATNINSSMKNTQILENNAYSLLTLGYDHKIASTSSLKAKKTQGLECSLRSLTSKMAAYSPSQRFVEKTPG